MSMFAYTSDKSQWDRDLLKTFSEAVYQLKVQAQGGGIPMNQLVSTRASLQSILQSLISRVQSLMPDRLGGSVRGSEGLSDATIEDINETQLAFTSLAFDFLDINPRDVGDRLEQLDRLGERLLSSSEPLGVRDVSLLDQLQSLLENEVAESTQSLYSF